MASIRTDQAEGLRRMVAKPAPRVVTFLSAKPGREKSATLVNLAASLVRTGSGVLLLDACTGMLGVGAGLDRANRGTLLQVACGQKRLNEVVLPMPQGFGMAVMHRKVLAGTERERMKTLFAKMTATNDIVLVDANIDAGGLPLQAIADGEIVVMVEDDTKAITSTYSLIKRLSDQYGRRQIGILVTGTDSNRAGMIYRSLSNATRRFLAIELQSVGSVPGDEHLDRATKLGRTVIDAFPLAGASVAFREIAGRFSYAAQNSSLALSAA